MDLSSNKVLRWTARILQMIVAGIFLVAALLKALDPAGFSDQIAGFGIFPHLSIVAAWCFIVAETVLATALLCNLLPRYATLLSMALLMGFIGVTVYSMIDNAAGSCGCFGNLVHRTPEQTIVEDALMIFALLFSFLVLYREQARGKLWKSIVSLSAGVFIAAVTFLSPSIPADSIVTDLRPGRYFDSWPVEGMYRNLSSGTHVVFLFSINERGIETDAAMMNTIAQSERVPSTIGLIVDPASNLTIVKFQYAIAFEVGALEPRFARRLYRTLPRTFILNDGKVEAAWSKIPDLQEILLTLARLSVRRGSGSR
jgi:hypothetical protein